MYRFRVLRASLLREEKWRSPAHFWRALPCLTVSATPPKFYPYSPPQVSRFDEPDIAFEDESPQEVTKISAGIGATIEGDLIAVLIGFVVGPALYVLFPGKTTTSLLTLTGIAASLASILIGRIINDLNKRLRL
jgi:hypothetical protein